MSKITVIGAGSVGATIANDLTIKGTASEIVLIDINEEKAYGEAMDIYQGVPFCSPAKVYSGTYEDAAGSDIVVITSGVPRKPGQTRLDLTKTNVEIIKDIAPKIVAAAPDAIYVIVSNPVDILTYVFCKISGVPHSHVIGSGTILDTSRLQAALAKKFHVSPRNIHAYVYGEHGDSSFVPWSLVNIANVHVDRYCENSPDEDIISWKQEYSEMEDFVRTSGTRIIKAKGATYYAVAMAVCHICSCIYNGTSNVLAVSTMLNGEYGLKDVCLSVPVIIDRNGVHGIIESELTNTEFWKLQSGAQTLKDVIAQLEF